MLGCGVRLYCNVCLLGSLRCGLFCSAVSCAGFILRFFNFDDV